MEEKKIDVRYLITPLWVLQKVEKKGKVIFNKDQAVWYIRGYELEYRKRMYDVLKWVVENPNYNYLDVMENVPTGIIYKYSNQEIHKYLMNFKSFMEVEEYGLLTDDRPTNHPWEK